MITFISNYKMKITLIVIILVLGFFIVGIMIGFPWERAYYKQCIEHYVLEKYGYFCKIKNYTDAGYFFQYLIHIIENKLKRFSPFGINIIEYQPPGANVFSEDETFIFWVCLSDPIYDNYNQSLGEHKIIYDLNNFIKSLDYQYKCRLSINYKSPLDLPKGQNIIDKYFTLEKLLSNDFFDNIKDIYKLVIIFNIEDTNWNYSLDYDILFKIIEYMKKEGQRPIELNFHYDKDGDNCSRTNKERNENFDKEIKKLKTWRYEFTRNEYMSVNSEEELIELFKKKYGEYFINNDMQPHWAG